MFFSFFHDRDFRHQRVIQSNRLNIYKVSGLDRDLAVVRLRSCAARDWSLSTRGRREGYLTTMTSGLVGPAGCEPELETPRLAVGSFALVTPSAQRAGVSAPVSSEAGTRYSVAGSDTLFPIVGPLIQEKRGTNYNVCYQQVVALLSLPMLFLNCYNHSNHIIASWNNTADAHSTQLQFETPQASVICLYISC